MKNSNLNVYRLLRIARDIKVKDLAEELQVTPAYINAIENGERVPSKRLLRDYAKALDVTEELIMSFDSEYSNVGKFEMVLLRLLHSICKIDDISNLD